MAFHARARHCTLYLIVMKNKSLLLLVIAIGLLFSCSFFFFHEKEENPHLTVIGFVNMADGLGRQSAELIDALKDDIAVNFISTRKSKPKDVPPGISKIVNKKSKTLGKVVLYEDMLWYPNHEYYRKTLVTARNESQIRIAYSMIESTMIPSEWVIILNTYFDAVAVPDPFLIAAYRDSGVTLPIFVLPLGLDLSPFLESPLKTQANTPFIFANLSACNDRKNHVVLIKAFHQAFGNRDDVQLVINCRGGDKVTKKAVQTILDELQPSNIIYKIKCLEKKAYLEQFQKVDCYVSLSKSEGFSIQPREAMALGIPVIATDNSGQSTICKSGLVKSVSTPIEEPAVYFWGDRKGSIFNCEVEEAAAAFCDVYENYSSYLQKAQSARDWVRQYQFNNLKTAYHSLANPKRIILGDEDKIGPDYLMTTSQDLYEKYARLVVNDKTENK